MPDVDLIEPEELDPARYSGVRAMLDAGHDPRQSVYQDEEDAIYNAEQHG